MGPAAAPVVADRPIDDHRRREVMAGHLNHPLIRLQVTAWQLALQAQHADQFVVGDQWNDQLAAGVGQAGRRNFAPECLLAASRAERLADGAVPDAIPGRIRFLRMGSRLSGCCAT